MQKAKTQRKFKELIRNQKTSLEELFECPDIIRKIKKHDKDFERLYRSFLKFFIWTLAYMREIWPLLKDSLNTLLLIPSSIQINHI